MFTYHSDSHFYWFNAQCVDATAEYTLIGTLFGLAIYNNIIVDIQFPMVIYKKLLGKMGTSEDMKDVDPVSENFYFMLL
jgi:ubiquitin-protein ligase E3 A